MWFGSSCKINKMFLRLFLSEKELFLWMYWEINAIIRIKDTEQEGSRQIYEIYIGL